jgi:hypothetical protein
VANNDPRLSVQERHGSLEDFQLNHAIELLEQQGMWLIFDHLEPGTGAGGGLALIGRAGPRVSFPVFVSDCVI